MFRNEEILIENHSCKYVHFFLAGIRGILNSHHFSPLSPLPISVNPKRLDLLFPPFASYFPSKARVSVLVIFYDFTRVWARVSGWARMGEGARMDGARVKGRGWRDADGE